jgi:hypothetical protein
MQSKSYFVMNNHPITSGNSLKVACIRNGFMGLEISTSAAGLLLPTSGDAREILSSQMACFRRCRQLPGILEWQPSILELPAINPANTSRRDEFRLNTFQSDNHAPPASPAK